MHTLAQSLNLPGSFVEIRHAATHEALPSVAVLRTAASRALEWLWTNYWAWVGSDPNIGIDGEDSKDFNLSRARLLLKQWRKLRREIPTREIKQGDLAPEARQARAIMKDAALMCASPEGMDSVIDAFLEEKGLIPSGKKYIKSQSRYFYVVSHANCHIHRKSSPLMRGAFLLWDPLLEYLDTLVSNFANQLIGSMLEILQSTPSNSLLNQIKANSSIALLASSSSSPSMEGHIDRELHKALLAWVIHLTGNPPTVKFGNNGTLDLDSLATQCIYDPNEWYVLFPALLLSKPAEIGPLGLWRSYVTSPNAIPSLGRNIRSWSLSHELKSPLGAWNWSHIHLEIRNPKTGNRVEGRCRRLKPSSQCSRSVYILWIE